MTAGTPTTFAAMKQKADHDALVRRALESMAFLAPMSAQIPDKITNESGQLLTLDEAWWPLGIVTPEGFEFGADTSQQDTEAHGYSTPVRSDIEKVTRSITVTALEKYKKNFMELTRGVDLSNVTQDKTSGEIVIDIPSIVEMGEYRMIVFKRDGRAEKEYLVAQAFTKVKLSEFPVESWNNEAEKTPLKFKVLVDTALGYPVREYIAGTGVKSDSTLLGFTQSS